MACPPLPRAAPLRQWAVVCAIVAASATAPEAPKPQFLRPPLATRGRHVVDKTGNVVQLACVNWYGAHLEQLVPNDLAKRPLAELATQIVDFGFNCVRLPFSLEMVLGNLTEVPDAANSLAANPDLWKLTPIEVFDRTVAALTDRGLVVILNNHVSRSRWCCRKWDSEGLWYTRTYPEEAWLRGLGRLTARYKNNTLVAAFDLRNEIRPSTLGLPSWGAGGATDWARGAQRGGERVLAEDPNMLIVVGGTQFNTILCQVPRLPLHQLPSFQGRLVYAAHEYPWVNFHLEGRKFVGGYLATILAWCIFLWLAVVAAWCVDCARARGYLASSSAGSRCAAVAQRLAALCPAGGACRRFMGLLELPAAIVFTSVFLVTLIVAPIILRACGYGKLIAALVTTTVGFSCAAVSLVLWLRLAFLVAQRLYRAPHEVQSVERTISLQAFSDEPAAAGAGLVTSGPAPPPPPRPFVLKEVLLRALATKQLRSCHCAVIAITAALFASITWTHHRYASYNSFVSEVDLRWGFLLDPPANSGLQAAPVWLGEFGAASNNFWWQHVTRYVREHDVDFSYWAFNGAKRYTNQSEVFGLLADDASSVRHPWKLADLQRLMHQHKQQEQPNASAADDAGMRTGSTT